MHPGFSKICILLVVLLGILLVPLLQAVEPWEAHAYTDQKTFKLDFDQKTFDYEQRQINETGDPYSYTHIYYGSGDKTFWFDLPKNGTISNSSLNITGLMYIPNYSPSGLSTPDIQSFSIGEINSSSQGNEIIISAYSSNQEDDTIREYSNLSEDYTWGYHKSGTTEYIRDTEIENFTSDTGNEIIVAGQVGKTGVTIFNSTRNVIWNDTGTTIYSLKVDDITSDSGNEIVMGKGDNKAYLLNSSLNYVWNFSTNDVISSVDVGELSVSSGLEIVLGSDDKNIYVLDSGGNLLWQNQTNGAVEAVAVGELNSSYEMEEIAAVTGNGTVYIFNSTGSIIWNKTVTQGGQSIYDIKIGEFYDVNPGNEIVLGSEDDRVYIYSSSGSLIDSYQIALTGFAVNTVEIGDINASDGNNENEILAGTRGGKVHVLSYDSFPTNINFKVNETVIWNKTGKFRTHQEIDFDNFTMEIQNFLDGCTEKVCTVPLSINSSYQGRLHLSDINISYTYDAGTDIHNQTISPSWAKNDSVRVNESVVSEAIRVSYTEPALNISIKHMEVNSGANACGFKNEEYSVEDLDGTDYCNVTGKGIMIVPGESPYDYHLLWDDLMEKDVPIILNESPPYNTSSVDNYWWMKNLTIWSNTTQEGFTNIIANVSIDDTIVKGMSFINVTWGGTTYNITPSTECPTMDNVGNGFTACYYDFDSNGVVDFFNWTQPNASAGSLTFYQVGGTRNMVPEMTSPNVNPSSGFWGRNFNFSVSVSDNETDQVNVTLWVHVNLTNIWIRNDTFSVPGNGLASFNKSSDINWVGTERYKFEYFDYNASDASQLYHSPRNTSNYTNPVINVHNVELNHVQGNESNVSREYGSTNTTLMVYLNDLSGYTNWPGHNSVFWATLDGNETDWGHSEPMNSSGYSNHSFNPNGSYSVGMQSWTVTLNETFYNITNPQNFTLRIRGHLNVTINHPTENQSVIRNQSQNFEAYLSDEYGSVINNSLDTSEYNCSFYFNGSFIGQDQVNSSGYCNVSWTPNCTYKFLKPYMINVTLAGNDTLNYTILSNHSSHLVNLVDYPNIIIETPEAGSSFYKGTQIDLNASLNDTCDTCLNNSYLFRWYVNYPYLIVNLNETSGIDRENEPVLVSGREMSQAGMNLTTWRTNDTQVLCSGWNTSVQIVGAGTYLNNNSHLMFVANVSSGQDETCLITHNESNSLANTTMSYIENGGFEGGENRWSCSECAGGGCNCTIFQEGSEQNGYYSLKLSGDDGESSATQNLNYSLNSQYIKVRFKAWGEYTSGAYLRLTGSGGTCELTPSPGISEGSAEWNETICSDPSFNGAGSLKLEVNDIGDGGNIVDDSHAYVDYICVADSDGNCLTLDSGVTMKSIVGRKNVTMELENSTESYWVPSIYWPVGPYTLFANLTGDYYISSQEETYVDIFGLGNVSYLNFTPMVEGECEGNLCFTGADLRLSCGVIDKNTTRGIYNFTTEFYNDSTNVGDAQTNRSGYSEYEWINSTGIVGAHSVTCNITNSPNIYYNVSEEDSKNITIIFSSDTTNGTLDVTSSSYDNAYNLTKENNDSLVFDILINNTGIGNMFGISVIVYNKTGIESQTQISSYLANGTTDTGNITFDVSRLAEPGNNSINISLHWSNPDPAGPGFENDTIVIDVSNTTVLNAIEDYLNYSLPYGSVYYSSFTIEDFGNAGLNNVTFNISGGDSSLIENWVRLNGTQISSEHFSVERLGQSLVNISVQVPDNNTYMGHSYWAYLEVNETGFDCTGTYDDCSDTILINITVTQQDWTLEPEEDETKVAGLNSNTFGQYALINITNHRNFNLTLNTTQLVTNSSYHERGSEFFSVKLNNSGYTTTLPDSFVIEPLSSAYLNVTYNSSDANSSDADTYKMNTSLWNQNSTTVPQWINISRSLMISDFDVLILSPNTTYPAGPLDAGDTIQIYANATLGEGNHLNESLEWTVWVGQEGSFQNCVITENTSNTTGAPFVCDWIINCTAPQIQDNPINNTMILQGNYTVLPLSYNDSETDAVIYNDISSPDIWTIEIVPNGSSSSTQIDNDPNVHYQDENTSMLIVRVNITDNNQTTVAKINVTSEGSLLVTNADLIYIGSYWEYNLTNPRQIGDYKVDVYAEDSQGNNESTMDTVTGYFDIYQPMQFYSNFTYPDGSPINLNISFYSPDTSWNMHHNYSSYMNLSVHKRNYDINVEVWDHHVVLEDADLNYSSRIQFGESNPGNITNPFRFDYLPNYTFSAINIMPSKFEDPIMGFVVEPDNLSSSGGANLTANITLSYADALQTALDNGKNIKTQNLEILECHSWDYSSGECTGGLSNADYIDVTPSGGTVNFQTTLQSAYILAEGCYANGNLIDCSGYEDVYVPSSGGGGSSSDDEEEQIISFDVNTNLDSSLGDLVLKQGETKEYWLYLTNKLSKEITPSLSVSGSIKDFLSFSETKFNIKPGDSKRVTAIIHVPEETKLGSYTGTIIVEAEGETDEIPVAIRVVSKDEGLLSLEVDIIKKKLEVTEMLKFQVKLRNLGTEKELKPVLTYLIKDGETDEILKEEKENVTLEKMLSFTKRMGLNETGLEDGEHLLEVWAETDGRTVSDMETFEIVKPFLATTLGVTLIYTLLILSIIIATIFIRKYYMSWKTGRESKKRYIFPVDMNKIPQKDENAFWIGTIAGSKIKAWINPADLTTHALVAGATGSGKSVGASVIVEEALEKNIPVIVFDPTAQWTGFVRGCRDDNLLRHYPKFGMDIKNVKSYKGMIFEMTDPTQKINFKELMKPGEITVFTLNKLHDEEFDQAVRNIIDSMFKVNWEEATTLKILVVFDEVHRLLEKYGGKGGYVALEKACREFRKWGLGLIMCSQVLADFKSAVSGNVLTDVQLNTKSLEDIKKARDKYGNMYAKRITRQGLGVGMIHNPKYNDGKPYFVQFRPTYHNPHKITNEELEEYKQFASELKEMKKRIGEMEKAGKDVFDIKLELRLAEDKLKQGNFRMAKIYITSLKKHLPGGA